MLLPAMGIVADIICTFSRKKLFNYKLILYTAFATGIISFFVWAHHQFVAGIDPRMANVFTITTLIISIPIAEMLFLYIATLYGGSIRLATPMLWALAFIAEFLIGGITGIFLGASGSDIYFHDTYFVLAHFHYTFFPIAIIGFFAGITYWFPKMFGSMMNETLGKIHFWGTIIGFNCIFIPLFILGTAGQHRRIYNFQNFPDLAGLQDLRVFATSALCGDARLPGRLPVQLRAQHVQGQARREEPVEGQHARVDHRFTAASRQLARGSARTATEVPTSTACRAAKTITGRKTSHRTQPPPNDEAPMSTTRPIATTRSATGIPTGKLAVWWVVGSEIVIFGGLLASYIMHRLGHPEWAEYASHTNTWFGGANTFVLLTSSLFAVLAHHAAEQGDGKKAAKWLLGTCAAAWSSSASRRSSGPARFSTATRSRPTASGSFYYTAAGHPRPPRHRRLHHHADHRERGSEGQRAPARRANRDLLALRRHRVDLPLPAALHRQVRTDDHG